MLLKVPWFTPGFSYCRWEGVECCLTSQESTLALCTGGLQSVGTLALTGQHQHAIICASLTATEHPADNAKARFEVNRQKASTTRLLHKHQPCI